MMIVNDIKRHILSNMRMEYVMEECMEENKILGGMMISICCEVDVQKLTKPTVKWWGDDGETTSEMKYQDVD
jgi:hypothetical protein